MYLEIITPDRIHFEGEVDEATFPGSAGSFQVLNNHAPLISTLGKGELRFVKKKYKKADEKVMIVDGGVVEVLHNRIIVHAESIER